MLTHLLFLVGTVRLLAQIDAASPRYADSAVMPISGQVVGAGALNAAQLRVHLVDSSGRVLQDAPIAGHGGFLVHPPSVGFYELRIVGVAGENVYTRDIHTSTATHLNIELSRQSYGGLGRISMARLNHKVPKAAAKHFSAARKALRGKDPAKAIEYLTAAAAEDPLYFDALSNLGAMHLQRREMEKSFLYLTKAHEIDPGDSSNNTNLAAHNIMENRFTEAEALARRTLRDDPSHSRAQYLLAFSLLSQGKDSGEAYEQLTQAQKSYQPAKALLKSLTDRSDMKK